MRANPRRAAWSNSPLTSRKIAPSRSSAIYEFWYEQEEFLFVDLAPNRVEDLLADQPGQEPAQDADGYECELHTGNLPPSREVKHSRCGGCVCVKLEGVHHMTAIAGDAQKTMISTSGSWESAW